MGLGVARPAGVSLAGWNLLMFLPANQGSLDSAWAWIGGLPVVLQGIVWLLFLPVMAGLWVWESGWPMIARLMIEVSLAGWSLLVFLPRRPTAEPS